MGLVLQQEKKQKCLIERGLETELKKTSIGWESADGLRKYRSPKIKPNSDKATTGTQANFETLKPDIGTSEAKPIKNGHLNITD